jgi:hypothetical protein
MPKAEKNKISHRGKALDKLKAWLKEEDVDGEVKSVDGGKVVV